MTSVKLITDAKMVQVAALGALHNVGVPSVGCRDTIRPFRRVARSGDPEDIHKTGQKMKASRPDDENLHNRRGMARDHLDSRPVASPNRQTESMKDGTGAVSDRPLLDALVSIRHGCIWSDPESSVWRHADANNEIAPDNGREQGLKRPVNLGRNNSIGRKDQCKDAIS